MPVTKKDIEHSLVQLRKIAAHREAGANKKIRKIYKELLADLKQFLGYEYAEYAKEGKLTYEILQEKSEYARFIEEAERRLISKSPELSKEIRGLIEEVYELTYDGMQKAVANSSDITELQAAMKGLRATRPEAIKHIVETGLADECLKKNWQASIYDIKRNIAVGLAQGDTIDTMAKRLTQCVDMNYKKAVSIARTETHRAREAGFLDSANDLNNTLREGVTDKRMVKIWKTMKDERVRPNQRVKTKKGWKTYRRGSANHEIMEDKAVESSEMFILSDGTETMAPGQSGVASQDVNCRCRLSYRLMSDAEYFKLTGEHFVGFKSTINDAEKEALQDYAGIYGKTVNSYMYGQTKNISDFERDVMNKVHTVLDKQSLPDNKLLYRGQSPSIFGKQAEAILADPQKAVGKTYTNKGFLSTSTNKRSAEMFYSQSYDTPLLFVIEAPKGSKGLDMRKISELDYEHEFLFVDKSKLTVVKAVKKDGKIVMKCKLETP